MIFHGSTQAFKPPSPFPIPYSPTPIPHIRAIETKTFLCYYENIEAGGMMTVAEAVTLLEGQFFTGEDQADLVVVSACGADLMSDVMAFVKDRVLLLTGLVNPQVIRTAELLDVHAVIFVRGKTPSRDMVDMAKEAGIILGGTKLPMFISCGKLYEAGLRAGGTRAI
jgi:hypothetical protein